ncbi:MAG: thiamine pyrophosphate-dependent dehydrogenase E1 component subunit alpha [Streptococcaceae bacterium]|jgi:pyruvate dehydrogenase E1 component alpha subunit|nr:thiamine pyrophosphate-dependent dehydrogenase E1 component subunit alpha [Streptococcaceae bacterium]
MLMEKDILKKSHVLTFYQEMLKIRFFEDILDDYNQQGQIHGTIHLYNGQEAIATGICQALKQDDLVLSTHRNHGHAIAKGVDTYQMFAEMFGKKTGTNGGRGGSMHISNHSLGFIGGNGIVGGNFPIALGLAQAIKMKGEKRIVVCFSGDGATNEGTFHEAMNIAALWQLPIIFVIENNQYAMSSPIEKMMSVPNLSLRANNYGMKGIRINGNNVFEVFQTMQNLVHREAFTPVLIEAQTYRFKGHSRSDQEVYRTDDEVSFWKNYYDPIEHMEEALMSDYDIKKDALEQLKQKIYGELLVEAQRAFNDDAPEMEELTRNIYA